MGDVLGWSDEQRAQQVDLYNQRVAAERDSQTKADDQAADVARTSVPDFTAAS